MSRASRTARADIYAYQRISNIYIYVILLYYTYELQKVFAISRKGRGYPNSFSNPVPFFGWRLVLQRRAIFMWRRMDEGE